MAKQPSIDWRALDFSKPTTATDTTTAMALLARQAIAKAVQRHKARGQAVYFRNRAGQLIKELPDGRQVVIRLDAEDREEETNEVPVPS